MSSKMGFGNIKLKTFVSQASKAYQLPKETH